MAKKKKALRKLVFLAAALVFLSAVFVLYLLFGPVGWEGDKKVVEVRQGEAAQSVAFRLKEAGVVRSARVFRWFARLSGADKKIKVGRYSFTSGVSLYDAVRYMASPKAGVVILSVPEGATIKKIAGMARSTLGTDSVAFVTLCHNRFFLRSLGLSISSLEGYLFPSNYEFYWGAPEEEVARRMFESFKAAWDEVTEPVSAPESLDLAKIVTMASLIEAETGVDSERVLVAQVFYRRLKLGYPLQCDPTVIYALGETKRALSHEDLAFRSPYNTYVNQGLPPGPICNPGKSALKAALAPAASRFLYFVANGGGGHIFSETLDQHNRAIYRLKKENRL